jgi:hypothetical protein
MQSFSGGDVRNEPPPWRHIGGCCFFRSLHQLMMPGRIDKKITTMMTTSMYLSIPGT